MTYDKHECDWMCERLAGYLEGDLAPEELEAADAHLASCASCTAVLAELRAIASQASLLPPLSPTRDLWAGIESRIGARVTPIGAPVARRAARRSWPLAIAAAALIALTAGTTYLLTVRQGAAPGATQTVAKVTPAPTRDSTNPVAFPQVAPAPIPPAVVSPVVRTNRKNLSVAHVYDREISLLDSLVRTRSNELDPKTVEVIQRNLAIIDSAIAESRKALARDPRSPLLNNRLDNVLGSKVELLRTIAFLPSQS
ncbi:MAG: zf-HC2 domain-containing protein [Gemmatimonadaceae bacterium]